MYNFHFLSPLFILTHLLIITHLFSGTSIHIPLLHMRKLRHRKVRSLAQSYTARAKVAQLEFCTRGSQGVVGVQRKAPNRMDQGELPGGGSK